MLVVMAAESLVADLLLPCMKMIKPWFVVILLAALIAQVGMSQMVDKMVEVEMIYDMFGLSLLNAAELPGANILVMIV